MRDRERRFLIVEDDPAVCQMLELAVRPLATEVFAAHSVQEGLLALSEHNPSMLIVDYQLGDGTADELLRAAREASVEPAAIVVSGTARPEDAFRLAHLGATAYIAKPIELAAVEAAVHRCDGGPEALAMALTPRERQIAQLVRLGYTNREIADALGVSSNAVRNRLVGIFKKCCVSTRAELAGVLPQR